MKITYVAKFRIDMGKAIPAVGALIEGINGHLSADGHDERIKYLASLPDLEITADRVLTEEETHKMKVLLEANMVKSFSEYDVRLVSFGRKSVTSESSAA